MFGQVDENDRDVTVNGVRYRAMLKDLWFQQVGATCDTAGQTINLLKEKLGNHII